MKNILVAASCILSCLLPVCAEETEGNTNETFGECGAISLYLLLEVAGVRTDHQRLVNALPPPTKMGYSLAELQAASLKLGLRLAGSRLSPGTKQIDRPLIAMMRHGDDRHYVLVRPVSPGSSLVQTLDPPFEPKIIPLDVLMANPGWTGLILQPMTFIEEVLARTKSAWVMFIILCFGIMIYMNFRTRFGRSGSSVRELNATQS